MPRTWLINAQGFKVTQLGGDVQVIPTDNPDQLNLFQRGDIDAVWTVEPWVSRLVRGKLTAKFSSNNRTQLPRCSFPAPSSSTEPP